MAETNVYAIGQYRSKQYNNSNPFLKNISAEIVNVLNTTNISNGSTDGSFRDKGILYNTFEKNKVYFVRLRIPKNNDFNITYDIKLISSEEQNDKYVPSNTNYQILKTITVKKEFSSTTSVDFFVTYDNQNYYSAPLCKDNTDEIKNNERYFQFDENNNLYTLYERQSEGEDEKIIDTAFGFLYSINKSSLTQNNDFTFTEDTPYDTIEFLFSPIINGNTIVIQKRRQTEDYVYSFIDDNGQKQNGISTFLKPEIDVYEVNNLLNKNGNNNFHILLDSLSKIGIWGHSNLCLGVNREEIRIGSRGFFELNIENFPINWLGVVCENLNEDRFLIDYEYTIDNE